LNNYSLLDQFLHRIALSSNYFKEICYDLEKSIFLDDDYGTRDNYVFVSGLARSGTTILLNALFETKDFSSITYENMPFIVSPNLWSKINSANKNYESKFRAHDDGIKISVKSPEALEEVFWSINDHKDMDSFEEFKKFTSLVLKSCSGQRYLSKNNQNIKRIRLLHQNFTNSLILIPFRNPLQHSFSLLNQHHYFIKIQEKDKFIRNYMKWIGHFEFGKDYIPFFEGEYKVKSFSSINHWLEQWKLLYESLIDLKLKKRIFFVCYEKLCNSNDYWQDIQSFIGVKNFSQFAFTLSEKKIEIDFDEDLYKSCLEIYNNLKN